ncbi:DUF5641 domain-containing protein [Trichonephila clavipes]|uniref:DUF5641 domain-containing protein n=1 Tax=Trichonephila clavipes TaxID=2585209 RepID=A0A8X6SLP3_TRICX|nr:DUF5641 domain-containing protein [Trichonephila clavipes]
MLILLCEGENILNGRPLTYVSDAANDTTAITPVHFIQDIRGSEVHDLDIIDLKHRLKTVRYLQNVRDNLRKRFQKENVGELVRNQKLTSKGKEITAGEIVLIGSDNSKRLNCLWVVSSKCILAKTTSKQ